MTFVKRHNDPFRLRAHDQTLGLREKHFLNRPDQFKSKNHRREPRLSYSSVGRRFYLKRQCFLFLFCLVLDVSSSREREEGRNPVNQ